MASAITHLLDRSLVGCSVTLHLAALVVTPFSIVFLQFVSTTERLTTPYSGWLTAVYGSISTGNHCQVTPRYLDVP